MMLNNKAKLGFGLYCILVLVRFGYMFQGYSIRIRVMARLLQQHWEITRTDMR